MNNIDEMPSKCHDCPYWEFAERPYFCDCEERYETMISSRSEDKNMDEKAQMLDSILTEEYVERLTQIFKEYKNNNDYKSELKAEAVKWAIDQILSSLNG